MLVEIKVGMAIQCLDTCVRKLKKQHEQYATLEKHRTRQCEGDREKKSSKVTFLHFFTKQNVRTKLKG